MPIKTFNCPQCQEQFELILSRADFDHRNSSTCPECDSDSPAAVIEVPSRRNPQHGIQK